MGVGRVQQRRAEGHGAAIWREMQRGGSGSEDRHSVLLLQRDFAAYVAATVSPHSRRRRRPIVYVSRSRLLGLKAFLATAFLMLGDYNVVLGMTLERHISRIGQKAAVHEHGIA